tara:strand:- start:113 stop:412 length:300 start_codon:yes stop_codon:yes gene_type:complete
VQIKTKKHFNEIIKSLTEEILDEEDLDEITTSAGAPGYMTPKAFNPKGKKRKKKYKKNSYRKKIGESIDDKDLKVITKLIRNVVGDILRDIWLKRTAWK